MGAGAATVAAVYADLYAIGVTGGTASKESAKEGETITLTLGAVPENKEFTHWTVNGGKIDGNTFVMGAGAATVAAVYADLYTVGVTGGTADKDSAKEGETVTLTPNEPEDGKAFSHWTVNDTKINGNTFVMGSENATVLAVWVELFQQIATPNNSQGKLFYPENANTPTPVAIDRSGSTMFTDATDYVLIYIYDAPDAGTALGTFKIITERSKNSMGSGAIASMDGTLSYTIVNGGSGNYYFDSTSWNSFFTVVRHELGYNYSDGQAYYFAAQSIAVSGTVNVGGFDITFSDSEISAIGATGFAKDKTKSAELFAVSVTDGLIDGEHTSVEAGYGVILTLSAKETKGEAAFAGWYLTDELGEDEATLLSALTTFTYTVTDAVFIKAKYTEEEIEVVKLATPDNSADQMILKKGSVIEYDRQKEESGAAKTAFVTGADYILILIYDSNENGAVAIASFKLMYDISGNQAYLLSMDGNSRWNVEGEKGNLFTSDGNAHNFIKARINESGTPYSTTTTYYFAAQAIAVEGGFFEDSDVGAKGSGWLAI
jgi:hypothetical protein